MIRMNICHSNQRDKMFIISSMFYLLIQISFVSFYLDISIQTLLMLILVIVMKLLCFKLCWNANWSCVFLLFLSFVNVIASLGGKHPLKHLLGHQ